MRLFKRRKEHYVSSDRDPDADEHEEIEYEPVSVKELLTEMKDISELMVDLAYSAAVLDSRDIADEVEDLESRMETLNYHVRLQAMMAARTSEDAERLAGILQVAGAAEKIADAAADIAKLTESEMGLRKLLPHLLKDADEKLSRGKVQAGSAAVDTTLGDANIEAKTGNRVIAVRRGKHWIYGPGRRFKLQEGDMLILRGREEGADDLKAWLSGKEGEL